MKKDQGNLFLYYKGPLHYDDIGELISELKEVMYERHVKQATYKKVLMVMIEALENIFKYYEHSSNVDEVFKKFPPEVKIEGDKGVFAFFASNPVNNIDIPELKDRLNSINSLNKEGIKAKYKEVITNGQFSEKGGAGLGIIEMAKLADSKLNYQFKPIDSDFKNFILRMDIGIS